MTSKPNFSLFSRRTALAALAAFPLGRAALAADDNFPNKPLRLIVPLGPGSAFDSTARFFAGELSKVLGQPVIVENKPGADTAIGVREVLTQPADGYTLLALSNSTVEITPFLANREIAYDAKDIRPFVGFLRNSSVFIVPPNSKFRTLAQVVEALRKEPQSVSLGNYGQIYRFGSRRFETLTNVRFNNIPYKAPTQVINDIVGGSCDMAVMETGAALPLVRSGKVRALAIAAGKRSPSLPDVPTVAEAGWADFTMEPWSSYAVSSRTPAAIFAKLEHAGQKVSNSAVAQKWALDRVSEPMPYSAEQMNALIAKETANFAPFIKDMRD